MPSPSSAVGIIPARLASSRLPAKPLLDLCGKPMVRRVYEQAARAKLLDRVIVATDSEQIAEAVRQFGGEAAMTPPTLRSGSDRIAAVAQSLEHAGIVVNIQGDEPLIAPEMIDEAVRPFLEPQGGRSSAPPLRVVTLVRRITAPDDLTNPGIVKAVLDPDGYAIYFSRSAIPYLRDGSPMDRWPAARTYYKHIGLYAYRRDFLLEFASWPQSGLELAEQLEQLRIIEHGIRIRAVPTEHDSIPVDTPADAERVRALLRRTEGVITP